MRKNCFKVITLITLASMSLNIMPITAHARYANVNTTDKMPIETGKPEVTIKNDTLWSKNPIPIEISAEDTGSLWDIGYYFDVETYKTSDTNMFPDSFEYKYTEEGFDYHGTVTKTGEPFIENGQYRQNYAGRVYRPSVLNSTGVKNIEYKLSGGSNKGWTNYDGVFYVTDEGETKITAKATDNVGNISEEVESIVRVDKSAPTFTYEVVEKDNNTRTIVFHIKDSLSGAYSITTDTGNTIKNSDNKTIFEPSFLVSDNKTYSYTITDNVGNSTSVSIPISGIDKEKPEISIDCNSNWSNKPIEIVLNAVDNGENATGIEKTEYKLSGATNQDWIEYTDKIVVSNDGITTITARTIDKAGNMSNEVTKKVRIDTENPNCNYTLSNDLMTNEDVTITLSSMDLISGVESITCPNGSIIKNTANELNFSINYKVTESNVYSFKIKDKAGNVFDYSVNVTNIDKNKPVVSFSDMPTDWIDKSLPVTLSAVDDGIGASGISKIEYKLSGAIAKDWIPYNSNLEITVEGETTITARAYDNAGNISEEVSKTVKIDTNAPTYTYTLNTEYTNGNDLKIQLKTKDEGSGIKYIWRKRVRYCVFRAKK